MEREKFLLKSSHGQWTEIIDKVLPVNVIISKFNKRTCEIMLGSCNEMSSKLFKIKDNESYNAMLCKIKIHQSLEEVGSQSNSTSLRDYMLHRHFNLAQKISKEKQEEQFNQRQSLNEIDNQFKSLLGMNQIILNKTRKVQLEESVCNNSQVNGQNNHPLQQGERQTSLRSLNNLQTHNKLDKQDGQKVENLIGFYKDKESSKNFKKYKIKVYALQTMQGDADSTLVISLEDKSHTSTLKQQKSLFVNTNQVFQKTLNHLQTLVKKSMSNLDDSNIKQIPSILLYNTLLINMTLHNIKDYLYIKTGGGESLNAQSSIDPNASNNNNNNNNIQVAKNTIKGFTLQKLELCEILIQLEGLIKRVCIEKNIHFQLVNETSESQLIITDKNRLYRVLVNYIANSINHTHKGYIQLKASNTHSLGIPTIKFELIDSGTGIQHKNMMETPSGGITTTHNIISKQNLEEEEDPLNKKPRQSTSVGLSYNQSRLSQYEKKLFFNQIKQQQSQLQYSSIPPLIQKVSNNSIMGSSNLMNYSNGNHINSQMHFRCNTFEDLSQIPSSSQINLAYQNNQFNTIANDGNFQNSIKKIPSSSDGLGISMLISKYLVNKLGPSFPKIYSKAGLGTNITFEVYQDLSSIHTSHKGSDNLVSFKGQSVLQNPTLPQFKHKSSSFNIHHNQLSQSHLNVNLKEMSTPSGLSTSQLVQSQKQSLNHSSRKEYSHQTSSRINQSPKIIVQTKSIVSSRNINNNQGIIEISLDQNQKQIDKSGKSFIQLDAQENIDEDGQEFLNLGGNCYKMIGQKSIPISMQKSENYLHSYDNADASSNIQLSQQNKQHSNLGIGSFINIQQQGQSQLQPFTLASNGEIFSHPANFGLNTSSRNYSTHNFSNKNIPNAFGNNTINSSMHKGNDDQHNNSNLTQLPRRSSQNNLSNNFRSLKNYEDLQTKVQSSPDFFATSRQSSLRQQSYALGNLNFVPEPQNKHHFFNNNNNSNSNTNINNNTNSNIINNNNNMNAYNTNINNYNTYNATTITNHHINDNKNDDESVFNEMNKVFLTHQHNNFHHHHHHLGAEGRSRAERNSINLIFDIKANLPEFQDESVSRDQLFESGNGFHSNSPNSNIIKESPKEVKKLSPTNTLILSELSPQPHKIYISNNGNPPNISNHKNQILDSDFVNEFAPDDTLFGGILNSGRGRSTSVKLHFKDKVYVPQQSSNIPSSSVPIPGAPRQRANSGALQSSSPALRYRISIGTANDPIMGIHNLNN